MSPQQVALFALVTASPVAGLRPGARPARASTLSSTVPDSSTLATVSAAEAEDLCARARDYVNHASGFYSPIDAAFMADDFVMRGPVIGPINKNDYINTMGTLRIYDGWPDLAANAFGFCVDPDNDRLVRFFVRNTGTNTGPISFGLGLELPPTGRPVRGPTEAFSIEFDADDRVRAVTIGYPVNRFEGNTGGLGAFIGLLASAGVPTPPPKSGAFKAVQRLGNMVPGAPKTVSDPDDVPAWWPTPEVRGADGM